MPVLLLQLLTDPVDGSGEAFPPPPPPPPPPPLPITNAFGKSSTRNTSSYAFTASSLRPPRLGISTDATTLEMGLAEMAQLAATGRSGRRRSQLRRQPRRSPLRSRCSPKAARELSMPPSLRTQSVGSGARRSKATSEPSEHPAANDVLFAPGFSALPVKATQRTNATALGTRQLEAAVPRAISQRRTVWS